MNTVEKKAIDTGRGADFRDFGEKVLTAREQIESPLLGHPNNRAGILQFLLVRRIDVLKTMFCRPPHSFPVPLGKTYPDIFNPFFLERRSHFFKYLEI
jgi:hypothetical protein